MRQVGPGKTAWAPVAASRLPAEPAEDGERIPGHDLPDQLAARLDLAMERAGELVGLFAGRCPDEDVLPAPNDLPPLALEPIREGVCLLVRRALDPDLPGRVAVLHGLFLPRRRGRIVVPAPLRGEPVLNL